MRENLVLDLREAADKWRANHPAVMTFEIRYDLALCEAADAIEELSHNFVSKHDMEIILEEVTKPQWIPVTERLPSVGEKVLVITIGKGKQYVETATLLATGEWFDCGNVTHWMPLPEPPKEERKDDEAD